MTSKIITKEQIGNYEPDKAREAANVLYVASAINSTHRAKLRSFLKGLGVPSDYADKFNTPDIKAIMEDPYWLRNLDNAAMSIVAHRGSLVWDNIGARTLMHIWEQAWENADEREEPTEESITQEEPKVKVKVTEDGLPLLKPADRSDKLAAIMSLLNEAPQVDEAAIRAIVDAQVEERLKDLAQPRSIVLTINEETFAASKPQHRHFLFDMVLKAVAVRQPVLLVGPAGSGKTTVARQIAEVLQRDFYAVSGIESAYQLKGFIDAHGRAVQTDFQRAFTQGGIFLFDELDCSDPQAVKTLNSAIDNRFCDFAEGIQHAHDDFCIIAGANTYGRGADRQYVGSNQLDASTLNRFAVIDWDYDEVLERAVTGNDGWCGKVQKWRKAKDSLKIRHVISPRASIYGARMLQAGWTEEECEQAFVWQGLDADQVSKVKAVRS